MISKLIFTSKNFICLSQSLIPKEIQCDIDKCLNNFLSIIESKKDVYQNDSNHLYTFYFVSNYFYLNIIKNSIIQIMENHNTKFYQPRKDIDIFFDEKIFPEQDLDIFLKLLKNIQGIIDVKRNVFDSNKISTYLIVENGLQKNIYDSIKNLLIQKRLIFNSAEYPLKNTIIINEKIVLQNEKDFDIIIKELKSKNNKPIHIERNKLLIYDCNQVRKLFGTFSFICFSKQELKMRALNFINESIYKDKKNVFKYKLKLYYASINENSYPKCISDYIPKIFNSFKGVEDIQRSVLSIESPVEKTYIGFDTIKHLKKCYSKFKNRFIILLNYSNPKLFIRKRNYQYFYIDGNPNEIINSVISLFAKNIDIECDIQSYCNEIGGVFRSYFGFKAEDDLKTGVKYLLDNIILYNIKIKIYKEGKSYKDDHEISYLFYDDL